MADDDVQYEFKSVRTIRGREASTVARWQSDGWELHTQSQGSLRTEMTFRRVKPRTVGSYLSEFGAQGQAAFRRLEPQTQRRVLAVAGSVILLVIAVGVGAAIQGGGGTPEPTAQPTAAAVVTSEQPSEEPSEEPSEVPTDEPSEEPEPSQGAEAAPVTDAEVLDAFQAFLDERASSGVVIAQAVTDVTFGDRVLRVTFDPAAAGIDQEFFDSINPFDNLAGFVGTPISFNDDVGLRVRPAIDAIETVRADGTQLGTMTTAEIVELNMLEE